MKTFEEKVKSLSFKQIVQAMIDSLKKPKTDRVDMGTYGDWAQTDEGVVCFGCAATNTNFEPRQCSHDRR